MAKGWDESMFLFFGMVRFPIYSLIARVVISRTGDKKLKVYCRMLET